MAAILYVHYVDRFQNVRVFDYNPATGVFTPTAAATGKAAIANNGSEITFSIDGIEAIKFLVNGEVQVVWVTQFVEPAVYPRLEFLRKETSVPERLAYITRSKRLWTTEIRETARPAGDDQFKFFDLISISKQGLYCDNLREMP